MREFKPSPLCLDYRSVLFRHTGPFEAAVHRVISFRTYHPYKGLLEKYLAPTRSTEAEVRAILEEAVRPEGRVKLGSLLAEIGRRAKLTDDESAVFGEERDKAPAEPMSFE